MMDETAGTAFQGPTTPSGPRPHPRPRPRPRPPMHNPEPRSPKRPSRLGDADADADADAGSHMRAEYRRTHQSRDELTSSTRCKNRQVCLCVCASLPREVVTPTSYWRRKRRGDLIGSRGARQGGRRGLKDHLVLSDSRLLVSRFAWSVDQSINGPSCLTIKIQCQATVRGW